MAMLKYGTAIITEPKVTSDQWEKTVCCGHKGKCACGTKSCRTKVARTILAKYSPEKYLLSHCTIVASVDVDNAKQSKSGYKDYLIKPEYSKYVNNNGDAWTKDLLAKTYKTFIGADNFCEHIQISELSKGKVIDAVLRDVPVGKDSNGKDLTTYFVDILVATDRKHKDLIRKIESGETSRLSMGCFLKGTEITLSDGTKRPIEEIVPGDLVITHTGDIQPVLNIQRKWYKGIVRELEVEGNYKNTFVTTEHPFWAFKKERICACGCGEKIDTTISGHESKSENGHPIFSRFKLGHYARIVNPNSKIFSLEDYKRLKEENPITEPLSLSWIEAGNLKERDIVSYPVSDKVIYSDNATIDKARLIGYFLAEGSFVKEVIIKGEENDYGVKCHVCGGIYNMISTHLPAHKIKLKEYVSLYPDAPIKAKIRKNLIRASRKDDLGISGFNRDRKRIGAEFSLGEHEYDTLNKEIFDLAKKVFPDATVLRYKNAVKIIGDDVANFFFNYCGEYADGKILPEEVMYWDKLIQKHLVSTWILGDYSTTISKKLSEQLRYLFYRLRINHNAYYVEESLYQSDVKKVAVNGSIEIKHYEGVRSASYMMQLNAQAYDVLSKELSYSFDHAVPKKLESVSNYDKVRNNWKNSHNLNSMVRPIQKITDRPYEGWVYNFEVAGDNSYIANDMAVHNCKISFSICSKCGNKAVDETEACQCVKYEKGNTFYDEDGIQRKVAELCGHASADNSVTFMDASWVANPAFTGAVVRNIINPPAEIMAKIKKAEEKEPYEYNGLDFLKAAHSSIMAKDPPKENVPAEDIPSEGTSPKDEPGTDMAETEAPAEVEPSIDTPEGVPPDSLPEEPSEADIKVWRDKIKKKLLKQISDEIESELSGKEEDRPTELETLDESLIQPTASTALTQMWAMKKNWDAYLKKTASNLDEKNFYKLKFGTYMILTGNDMGILKDYGYNKRDFLAVLSSLDGCFRHPLSLDVKKALAVLGGTNGLTLDKAKYSLQKIAGRKLQEHEIKKAFVWLKLMDLYQD